jgi:hypothetical protein
MATAIAIGSGHGSVHRICTHHVQIADIRNYGFSRKADVRVLGTSDPVGQVSGVVSND